MKILVVDDDRLIRLLLLKVLKRGNYEDIVEAESGEDAIELIKKQDFDLVICDLMMSGISGEGVLDYLKQNAPTTLFLLLTAHGTVKSAVNILKKGALDYITKPFDADHLLQIVSNARETIRLRRENDELKGMLYERYQFDQLIGKSNAMKRIFTLLQTVCESDTNVLIIGETGTGKGLVAHTIHYNSARREKPFVTVSCAALTRELLDSELFGHERGSFTGAIKQKKGRFELADTGTLFLDEVDDIPLELQVKLLRVIETGEFERVGGEKTLNTDVRLIAASKVDLYELVQQGKFRRDLYYRLNVIPIHLPPLRDRKEDLPLLVDHFLKKYSPDRPIKVAPDITNHLLQYPWDGNVRELEHLVERLVLLNRDGYIDESVLSRHILKNKLVTTDFEWGDTALPDFLFNIERQLLIEASERTSGSKTQMADLLKIPLPTLKSKLKKFEL